MMLLYIRMKKYVKLGLLLLVMALIFFFSAQPADNSTVQTNFVIDILYSIYKGLFFNSELTVQEFTVALFKPVRKLAHFSEFALLGILAYLNINEYRKKNVVILSIVFSALYALTDEIHQIFVPGRACALFDMFIDTCGATFGIILIHLLVTRWIKEKH